MNNGIKYEIKDRMHNYDIDKSKNLMKSMKELEVFSSDGFHQTIYGKKSQGHPELCLLFDTKDMHSTSLLGFLENINSLDANIAILLTNDPNFHDNADFLVNDHPKQLIVMRESDSTALILGQPEYFRANVHIDSNKFSTKNIDKFVASISSLSIDERFLEMPKTWAELESIDTSSDKFRLNFGLYVNYNTDKNYAITQFRLHIKEYLRSYGMHDEIEISKIASGFYNNNRELQYQVQHNIESSIQRFLYSRADHVFFPQNLLINNNNLLGISCPDQQRIQIVNALI